MFITSKLWNTYHHKEHVEPACRRSLQDLGVDCLDLYLVHFPISLKFVPFETRYPPEWEYDPASSPGFPAGMVEDVVAIQDTWRAMEGLVVKGLVKNIGFCNIGTTMLRDIMSYASVPVSVLQVELHPYNTQERLVKFCLDHHIAVTGFSNLGAGSYLELNMATKEESCLEESVVQSIAAAHGKTPAQIVLRWAVQRGTAVIPKSTKSHRLVENIDIFNFALSDAEMASIAGLNKNKRFNDPAQFANYPIYE
jgi:D-xylose reductase